jgi:hypothetical protein
MRRVAGKAVIPSPERAFFLLGMRIPPKIRATLLEPLSHGAQSARFGEYSLMRSTIPAKLGPRLRGGDL